MEQEYALRIDHERAILSENTSEGTERLVDPGNDGRIPLKTEQVRNLNHVVKMILQT